MTNTNNCLVSVADKTLDSNIIFKRLKKIFENHGVLCDISVVLDVKSLPPDIDSLLRCIHKFETSDYTELSTLLQEVSLSQEKGYVVLEAFPMHQISENLHLNIVDTLKFNSITGQITLQLTEKCYQSCPLLVNNKEVTITKINNSKKGHGSSHSASFNYMISLSILNISAEIDYIVETIFGNSQVTVLTNRLNPITSLQNNDSETHSSMVILQELSTMVQVPQVSKLDIQENYNSIYEYLTLLHMNSPLLTEGLDTYISSYQGPEFKSITNLDSRDKLYKYTFGYMDSFVWDSLINHNWRSISGYTNDSHVLILNDSVHQNLVLWECK